jgi:hypothetical protein
LPTAHSTDAKKRASDFSVKDENSIVDQEDVHIGGGFASINDILDARPDFIKEEFITDIERRRPDHPDFDPTTLYIPAKEWKVFTPCMV